MIPSIQGLKTISRCVVRGELICAKADVTDTLARSWVNGVLHRSTATSEDLRRVRFIG